MAQDVKIVAPDSIRQVTVTNQGQAVALDVNVVNAAFTASINVSPTMSVTNSAGSPLYVTGNFAATVTPTTFSSSTFILNQWQVTDIAIPDGAVGASLEVNTVGGELLLGGRLDIALWNSASANYSPAQDTVDFGTHANLPWDQTASGSFPYGSVYTDHSGRFALTSLAGAKHVHFQNTSTVAATCTVTWNSMPYDGVKQVYNYNLNGATVLSTPFIIGGGFRLITSLAPYEAGMSIWIDDSFSGTMYVELGHDYTSSFGGPGGALSNWMPTQLYNHRTQQWVQYIQGTNGYGNQGENGGFYTITQLAGWKYVALDATYVGAGNFSGSFLANQVPFVPDQVIAFIQGVVPITGTVRVNNLPDVQKVSGTHTYDNTDATSEFGYFTVQPAVANANAPSYTEGKLDPLSMDLRGRLRVTGSATVTGTVNVGRDPVTSTANHSTAALALSSLVVLSANPNRMGCTLANTSRLSPAFVYFGHVADWITNQFTVRIPPNGYYEVPYGYTGEISAIRSGSNPVTLTIEEFVS